MMRLVPSESVSLTSQGHRLIFKIFCCPFGVMRRLLFLLAVMRLALLAMPGRVQLVSKRPASNAAPIYDAGCCLSSSAQ